MRECGNELSRGKAAAGGLFDRIAKVCPAREFIPQGWEGKLSEML